MAFDVRRVECFHTTVEEHAGEGARLLARIADVGVNLLAFKAVPLQSGGVRFTLFSGDARKMSDGAKRAGFELDGPRTALLIRGDDESGALAEIYRRLSRAGVEVEESNGIADIGGSYGVVLYLPADQIERAEAALSP